jgi:hypothetical protein
MEVRRVFFRQREIEAVCSANVYGNMLYASENGVPRFNRRVTKVWRRSWGRTWPRPALLPAELRLLRIDDRGQAGAGQRYSRTLPPPLSLVSVRTSKTNPFSMISCSRASTRLVTRIVQGTLFFEASPGTTIRGKGDSAKWTQERVIAPSSSRCRMPVSAVSSQSGGYEEGSG